MIIQPSMEVYHPNPGLILPPKGLIKPPMRMGGATSSYLNGVSGKRRVTGSPYYPVGPECSLYHDYGDGLESAADHSLYGNDGTVVGGGFVPLGVSLDGINDVITVVPNTSLAADLGDITLACWVNYTQVIAHGDVRSFINIFGTDGEAWNGITLNILGIEYGGFDRTYTLCMLNGGSPYQAYENPGTIVDPNLWLFLAYVVDRDIGGYFYCNGNMLVGPVGTLNTTHNLKSNHQIRIGAGNTVWQGGFLQATFGQAYVFMAAKTKPELDDIFNFTKSRYEL